jgi:lipoprotein-releasing system permease protein
VLSVFNGFEDLITSMYSSFNPQVKASPAKGKTFELKPGTLERLRQLEEVQAVSQTLEEVAFFEYRDKQDFGVIKGVDEWFNVVTGIGKTVKEGRYALKEGSRELAVLGLGMYNKLTVSTENYFEPLHVYLPKKRETSLFEPQFTKRSAYPTGVFFIQQDFDNRYVLTSLELCQSLLGNPRALSALEFRLKPGVPPQNAIPKIQAILGPDIVLRDRYQQEEAFMRLMKIEKWMSFAIVSLTLLMVAFNMVGALWMSLCSNPWVPPTARCAISSSTKGCGCVSWAGYWGLPWHCWRIFYKKHSELLVSPGLLRCNPTRSAFGSPTLS